MAGQIFLPHGTTVTFSSSDIGGVQNVTPPTLTRGEAEYTNNDSSGVRQFLPGLIDAGTVVVVCRRIPGDAGQEAARTNLVTVPGASEELVITLPAGATTDSAVITITMDAFVSGFEEGDLAQDADEVEDITITFRVDGLPTETTP